MRSLPNRLLVALFCCAVMAHISLPSPSRAQQNPQPNPAPIDHKIIDSFNQDALQLTDKKDNVFENCNTSGKDVGAFSHTYENISTPPMISKDACTVHFSYTGGPGKSSGFCRKCFPDPFCGCFCIISDLVEYYYPSYKVDQSNEFLRSPYFTKDFLRYYSGQGPARGGSDIRLAAQLSGQSNTVIHSRNIAEPMNIRSFSEYSEGSSVQGRDVKYSKGKVTEFPGTTWRRDETWNIAMGPVKISIEPKGSAAELQPPDVRLEYPQRDRSGKLRSAEELWWIPHISKYHLFGSDLPHRYGSPSHEYIFNALLTEGMIHYMFNPEWACRRETPPDEPRGSYGESPCVDTNWLSVYPRYVLKDVSNPILAAALRQQVLFNSLFDDGGGPYGNPLKAERHSYMRNLDRFYVMRGSVLPDEPLMCQPIDALIEASEALKKAGKAVPLGMDITFEVFPRYKGCWGFKGADENWWSAGVCNSGVFEVPGGNTALRQGYLRLH